VGLLEDLATALQDADVGTLGTNLFLGWLPDAPDNALALYETGGQPPSYTHHALTPAIARPSIQVMVRDHEYVSGRERIDEAYAVLCGLSSYLAIQPIQPPFALGRDAHDRARFSVNFNLTIVES
jgi:hypothetical protein